jgi:hypothetical protein
MNTVSDFLVPSLTRSEFLAAFQKLANRFENHKRLVASSEEGFRSALAALLAHATDDPMETSVLAEDDPLRERVGDQAVYVRGIVGHWADKVQNRDLQAEFRDTVGDSLLVFVYGKVKAGKSSLGNYVATGQHNPRSAPAAHVRERPEFFVYTSTGRTEGTSDGDIRTRRHFGVDQAEATSAIQGFRLPGLTWVDSPGLHSKTEENGKLAKQFVDAADLILYLTSSTAPGKRSDVLELQELGRREHTMAVLVTGSDMFDEDVDERGDIVKRRVMKSEADRRAQRNYMRSVLNEDAPAGDSLLNAWAASSLRKAAVYSISVRYAEDHADARGIAESGVGEMLHDVAALAEGAGVRGKLEQPLRNLRAFLQEVHAVDLPKLQEALAAASEDLDKVRNEARARAHQEKAHLRQELAVQMAALARQHAMNDAAFRQAVTEALNHCVIAGAQAAARAFAAVLDAQLPIASEDLSITLPSFGRRTAKIPRKRAVRSKVAAAVIGAAFGLAAIATGGTAAIVLGVSGPVAALMGKKVGEYFDDEEVVPVDIGDNVAEVAEVARERAETLFNHRMDQAIARMDTICLAPNAEWIVGMRACSSEVAQRLQVLVTEIDRLLVGPGMAGASLEESPKT